ncbi:MAG: cobalt transporter CbiM [Armatimonadota bacterium]
MHIPDGYLGPQTYLTAYAVTAPFWIAAVRNLNKTLRSKNVPKLALGAAFSFVIMMFNVPIIGGTTGHAVGAVLVAILMGPYAACIAVSLALIAQAFIFGDGGITCIGANCFNMAVVMPFVGYGVYRLIAGKADLKSKRQWIGAAVGGYIGINTAAFVAAVMFGLQPLISHNAAGEPLYAPYPLNVTIPAMVGEHMLVFGIVEAIVTGLVVIYLQKTDTSMLYLSEIRRNKETSER